MDETKMERFSKFLNRHRTAITVTATAIGTLAICIAVNRAATNDAIEFIKEHDLYDEYLTAGEE